jgi:hypothetical protein
MKLMAMSRETNDPRPRSMGLWALATVDVFSGSYADAIENADEALRVSLCPVDRDTALLYKAMAMVLSGQVADGMALLARVVGEMEGKGFFLLMGSANFVLGVGMVLQGDMAGGIRAIEDAAAKMEEWGQTALRPVGDLFLGETYLQFAISEEKPPLSVMLKNLPFLLRTLPFAKAKARRYLASALDGFRADDNPSGIARCLYDLGLLDKAGKKAGAARAKFDEAREIAASVEATNLVTDIDAALAELPAV